MAKFVKSVWSCDDRRGAVARVTRRVADTAREVTVIAPGRALLAVRSASRRNPASKSISQPSVAPSKTNT